jgi:hypothetical protein
LVFEPSRANTFEDDDEHDDENEVQPKKLEHDHKDEVRPEPIPPPIL